MAVKRYLKDLPPDKRGRYDRAPDKDHLKIVKALQRRPEQWLMVREFQTPQGASRFARRIRESEFLAFRDGTYEAHSRSGQVFARYMGD